MLFGDSRLCDRDFDVKKANAISAVNPRGEFCYKQFTRRLNKHRFVAFLKSFMRGGKYPVMMIVDGHPAHRARIVRGYVQELKRKLKDLLARAG